MNMPDVAKETKPQAQTFGRQHLSPGAYTLDLSAVGDRPMQMNGQPSNFVEVYCKLRDSKVKETPRFFDDKYVTEEGELHLKSDDWTLTSAMRTLVELLKQGIDPHHVHWFYYTHDWSRDADEHHTFFAFHDGKVIMESCNFNSETPLILKRKVDDEPIWNSHPYFDEAFECHCYRRFYTETLTGQLMVLRPDEPILYHYERPQSRDVMRDMQFWTLVKLYRLAWVAIPLLVALVLPSIKVYMEIAAGYAGAEVLRLCWVTRKVGKPA